MGCTERGAPRKRAFALLLLLAAPPLRADPPHREMVDIVGASVNVLGLQQSLEVSWTWKLNQSTNPLLSGAHFALGVTNDLSPAFIRVSGWAQWAPLSVLMVRAGVEPVYYFGILGSLIGFPSRDSVFDEDAREALRPQAVSSPGARFFVAPMLQGRFGRVLASSTVAYEHWEVDGPDDFFYEPRRDTLLASNGDTVWRVSSVLMLDLGAASGQTLQAGFHHEFQRVRDAPQNDVQRVGPLVVWGMGGRRFGLRDPALIANLYYYLEDPYKRHEPGATVGLRFGVGR